MRSKAHTRTGKQSNLHAPRFFAQTLYISVLVRYCACIMRKTIPLSNQLSDLSCVYVHIVLYIYVDEM